MSFGDRRGKHLICVSQSGVVCIVPAVFIRNILSVGYGAQFCNSDQIIDRAERFAARPIVILFGNGEEPFPGFEVR